MKKLLLLLTITLGSMSAFAQGATCAAATAVTSGTTYAVAPITTGTYVNSCGNDAATKAVWYKFQPAQSGIMTIDSAIPINHAGTLATDVDSRVTVMTGTCSGLTCVNTNDDVDFENDDYRARLTDVIVTAGNTYFIEWDNRWTSGTVAFSWTFTFTAQSCFVPTAFTFIDAPTTTTATIGWTAPTSGTPAGYDFEYGLQGFTQGGGTVVTTAATQVPLTGLTPSTVYQFYIRTNCGATDHSIWVGPITFHTDFETATMPYTTGFENTSFDNIGWFDVTSTSGNGSDWFVFTGSAGSPLVQEGVRSAVSLSNAVDTADGELFSRGVALTAGDIVTIKYWVRDYLDDPLTQFGTASYILSAFDNLTGTQNVIQTVTGLADQTFIQKIATFNPPTTDTYFFHFLHNSPLNFEAGAQGMILDNFTVTSPLTVNDVLTNKFSIFPNPASSVVNISNTENILVRTVSVTDINGRIIQQSRFSDVSNVTVNVGNLSSGVYMLKIDTDQGSAVKKFVKN